MMHNPLLTQQPFVDISSSSLAGALGPYEPKDAGWLRPNVPSSSVPPSTLEVNSADSSPSPPSLTYSSSPSSQHNFPHLATPASHTRRRAHIPRPPNAFLLFRSSLCAQDGAPDGGAVLSQQAGELWRGLREAERAPWDALAREVRREHARKYPGYASKPRTIREQKSTPVNSGRKAPLQKRRRIAQARLLPPTQPTPLSHNPRARDHRRENPYPAMGPMSVPEDVKPVVAEPYVPELAFNPEDVGVYDPMIIVSDRFVAQPVPYEMSYDKNCAETVDGAPAPAPLWMDGNFVDLRVDDNLHWENSPLPMPQLARTHHILEQKWSSCYTPEPLLQPELISPYYQEAQLWHNNGLFDVYDLGELAQAGEWIACSGV